MSGPVPDDKRPLPDGWIRQWDSNQNHFFYVDTRATPPRAIWTHPLDDPEYQRSHKKDAAPSYSGYLAPPGPPPSGSQSNPELGHKRNDSKEAKRGAFTKLKDKLIGTKEEREAERRAEQLRREQERLQREQLVCTPVLSFSLSFISWHQDEGAHCSSSTTAAIRARWILPARSWRPLPAWPSISAGTIWPASIHCSAAAST
ncbi:hypothetical protein EXIGLDRAFT_418129 [Exidia glandulosa HHB12029]|uniref:WW domain-containing protein n=1 Tax=Exidia glandulosa HHB12029 TaxID=1314781 RepID=A0A165PTS9_EXIGL|nr:hypothetical protein EXIGLDRAFT_418129 [Exidia glandulosa HHB12029]